MKKYLLVFLGFILTITIVGAIIGLIGGNKRKKLIDEGEVYIAVKNDTLARSILGIEKDIFIENYLGWIHGQSTTINFQFIPLNSGQKVYLIDSVSEEVIKVAIFNSTPTATKPNYQELYIWRGFVTK